MLDQLTNERYIDYIRQLIKKEYINAGFTEITLPPFSHPIYQRFKNTNES